MQHLDTPQANPRAHLLRQTPDHPVLYFSPAALQAQARAFLAGFDGEVTYAVKANPDPAVLDNLVMAGLEAFDVASPAEMAAVRGARPDARLHYHNPVRSAREIAAARRFGVVSWSVDALDELDKLGPLDARDEIAVRLALPVAGGAYDFGAKFGAPPDLAVALLQEAERRGARCSITFHPGTQCGEGAAWATYIAEAARIAAHAGVRLHRLNVGGGFPAPRGRPAPLAPIFAAIHAARDAAFGAQAPGLVCEPGRGMVAPSCALALRVKGLRPGGGVVLNDGLYGTLAEARDMGLPAPDAIIGQGQGAPVPRRVWGPTCDSLDMVPDPVPLPDDLAPGDWLVWQGMGAYSGALASPFNGYGRAEVVAVQILG